MYTKDSELVRRIVEAIENCDPLASTETLCEAAAEVLNTQQAREWTAEDVSDEQVDSVFRKEWGSDESDRWREAAKGTIAAAANIMRVTRPQPAVAVDVERLAVVACEALDVPRVNAKFVAEMLRRELSQEKGGVERLAATGEQESSEWQAFESRRRRAVSDRLGVNQSQPKAAESEWPADAPEWAAKLTCDEDGSMWFWGVVLHDGTWEGEAEIYTGTRPASWAGLDWTKCVLRRPGGASER